MVKEKETSAKNLHDKYLHKLVTYSIEVSDVEKLIVKFEEEQKYESCKALKEAIEYFKDSVMSVIFGFNNIDILGAFDNDIYIRGFFIFNDDNNNDDSECVIIIDRELYNKAFILWLDEKKKFCETHGHFCGVMGYIGSHDFEEVEKYKIIDEVKIEEEEEEDYLKEVRAFRMISFNECIDMEHG